jgi:hypothetical protein
MTPFAEYKQVAVRPGEVLLEARLSPQAFLYARILK